MGIEWGWGLCVVKLCSRDGGDPKIADAIPGAGDWCGAVSQSEERIVIT